MSLTEQLKQKAIEIGFDLVGISAAAVPGTLDQFETWLDAGYAGEMGYIERRRDAYADPEKVLIGVKSVIMTAISYDPKTEDQPQSCGRFARYAQSTRDYHDVIRELLQKLAAELHQLSPGCKTRAIVDTAPLLERDFARSSGLGWFGKNTMLLTKSRGSYLFLGALLTTAELDSDEMQVAQHCGTCTRCLDACPTDAFVAPYILDARKCISYLTIELRDKPIEPELHEGMQDWLFGCDVCQEVCPWNRHSQPTRLFPARSDLPDARECLTWTEEEFLQRFAGTPMERTGWETLARTAAIILGNRGDAQDIQLLLDARTHPSELVRDAVMASLKRLNALPEDED